MSTTRVPRTCEREPSQVIAYQGDLVVCRQIGDRHGEGVTLNNLGIALRDAGRLDEAITAHHDAAAIFRETGDRHGEAIALNNLESDRVAHGFSIS